MIEFSIIIPTLNSSPTLRQCLESVLRQDFKGFEIIVIDGKSTDPTVETLAEYTAKFKNITVLSEKDNGIYDAMNKGIHLAKGSWLYFLGSDDSLYNSQVLTDVSIKILASPQSAFLYGDVSMSNGIIQNYKDHSYNKLCELNICQQSIFYRNDIFDNRLYSSKFSVLADWDLNLQVFRKKYKPQYLNMIIANYSLNGISNDWMNHKDYIDNFENKIKLILRYRNLIFLSGYLLNKSLFTYFPKFDNIK